MPLLRKMIGMEKPNVGQIVWMVPRVGNYPRTKLYFCPALAGSAWYELDLEKFEEQQLITFLQKTESAVEAMAYLREKNLARASSVSFSRK